jgi:hypothetical protein
MTTIRATVNTRLLTKASRLFTGTLPGRIIEVLQNAHRAGAKHVVISNQNGVVTVRDDGRGIRDFPKLLDLGGSDWEARLEASEDPAGVGLFCLAPRQLTIRSKGYKLVITEQGWTGAPVNVVTDPHPLPIRPSVDRGVSGIAAGVGTELAFADDPWDANFVKSYAAFTGMDVTVDGEPCPKERFLPGRAVSYPLLGCRIQVVPPTAVTHWHTGALLDRHYGQNTLLCFHGQEVAFNCQPVSLQDLHFLVDMTGQPTGIRLMLPARTCLVENDALDQLKAALEREAFLYLQRQKQHRLPYKEYLRAKELGIELPEAHPTFKVGLLHPDMNPQPVEVVMPKDHPLSQCYRLADTTDGQESDEANVHLLAALGKFDTPFMPVEINPHYDGYTWAKLPTIGKVQVAAGKMLQESWIGSGKLICVESLSIAAHASDGKLFRSTVCMAVKPSDEGDQDPFMGDMLYVTPAAQQELYDARIWCHLGGFSDDGDTYDTQEYTISKELEQFWQRLIGPHETLRSKLLEAASSLDKGWKEVTIKPNGQVIVRQKNGREQVITPPGKDQEVTS